MRSASVASVASVSALLFETDTAAPRTTQFHYDTMTESATPMSDVEDRRKETNTNEEETEDANNDENDDDTTPTGPHHHKSPATWSEYAETCFLIVCWYGMSCSVIFFTKWLFTTHFPYPLTVTCFSNSLATLWAVLVSRIGCTKDNHIPLLPSPAIFRRYVLPIGIVSGFQLGCGNKAVQLLTVSFRTILTGAGPIFTFGWGVIFGLEQFSCKIGTTLLIIALGLVIASVGELTLGTTANLSRNDIVGLCLELISTTLVGLKWTIVNKFLLTKSNNTGRHSSSSTGRGRSGSHNHTYHAVNTTTSNTTSRTSVIQNGDDGGDDDDDYLRDEDTTSMKPLSPLAAILYTSPMTSLCVLPFAIIFEGKPILQLLVGGPQNDDATDRNTVTSTGTTGNVAVVVVVLCTMTLIATLVFVLLMSQYWLVQRTSSVTLQVAGVGRYLIIIGGGLVFFHELIDTLHIVGFVVSQVGIMAYARLRTQGSSTAPTTSGSSSIKNSYDNTVAK